MFSRLPKLMQKYSLIVRRNFRFTHYHNKIYIPILGAANECGTLSAKMDTAATRKGREKGLHKPTSRLVSPRLASPRLASPRSLDLSLSLSVCIHS